MHPNALGSDDGMVQFYASLRNPNHDSRWLPLTGNLQHVALATLFIRSRRPNGGLLLIVYAYSSTDEAVQSKAGRLELFV